MARHRQARARRTARRLGRFLAGLALVAVVVLIWPARLGGASVLVVVQGRSMEPTHRSGDLVVARVVDDVTTGDVVVYRIPEGQPGAGQLVMHRVRSIRPDGRLVLQGDNRRLPDDLVLGREDVVARAVFGLGPWPIRVLGLSPYLSALGLALVVGWYLWPPPAVPTARRPVSSAARGVARSPRSRG